MTGDVPASSLRASIAVAALLWLLAASLFVVPQRTMGVSLDLIQFFNWINAVDHGQLPSRDFQTPIGVLTHYLPWLGFRLLGGFAGAVEAGSVIALAILLPSAVIVLRRRVGRTTSMAFLVAASALVVVPWNPGDGPMVVSQFLFYNRWCWSALAILWLFIVPARGGGSHWVEGGAIGALLLLLFFVKVSYFAVGLVFVGVFGLLLGRFRPPAAIGLGGLLAGVAGVQAFAGFVDDYISQVGDTLRASGLFWRDPHDVSAATPLNLRANAPYLLLVPIACGFALTGKAFSYPATARPGLEAATNWLFALFALAASVAILGQNGAQACTFALVAVFALINHGLVGWRRGAVGALLAAFMLPTFISQCVVSTLFQASPHHYRPMALPRMANVFFADAAVLAELRTGVELLARNNAQRQLLVFDHATWFPVFFNVEPRRGRLWCLHVGRTINREMAPTADELFANVRHVMVPKSDVRRQPRQFLMERYGGHLAARYQLVDENEHWRLFAPKNADAGGASQRHRHRVGVNRARLGQGPAAAAAGVPVG